MDAFLSTGVEPRVTDMIREFAASQNFADPPQSRMIYQSAVFPDTRQVWQVTLGQHVYALKLDYQGEADGPLAKEFKELGALAKHFAKYEKLGLVTPVYLSPTGKFMVTRFLDLKTAGQRLKDAENPQTRGQVFRRAGDWLHALHDFSPRKRKEFWGNWMIRDLDEILARGDMQADPEDVTRMRDMLHTQVRTVNRIRDTHATSHGDFHSENLMLGPGITYGFDLSETRRKMAVYDIVDFLKVDIYRDTPPDEVDSAGITASHRDMFFRGYTHHIDKQILDVALRGRLLIDWALTTPQGHTQHRVQRIAFRKLKLRLDIAFGDT